MTTDVVTTVLAECETVIEAGLATFVEVGNALLRIRDERLYRDTHGTFEDYCRERWGISRTFAYDTMASAQKVSAIADIQPGLPQPRSESIARELPREPEGAVDAWSEAVERHGDKPTALEVREIVAERNGKFDVHFSSATDEWATPQDFFNVVHAEFGFDLDACALPSSAKCERYFGPEQDGLAQNWTGTVWMNPPYGDVIGRWVQKAHESAQAGATVVCLVPARTDTAWFHDHCLPGEVRLIRGRLRFGDADASAPFPSALVVLGPNIEQRAYGWDWR